VYCGQHDYVYVTPDIATDDLVAQAQKN